MNNRCESESSPYLIQHKDNPYSCLPKILDISELLSVFDN
jgi:hypothetical protein